ncbi:hypothetical protein J6590_023307 [Homalodisca vitripennis]|nr:hypothetical protein J6590_023307 [Homalodisca vitripennis]
MFILIDVDFVFFLDLVFLFGLKKNWAGVLLPAQGSAFQMFPGLLEVFPVPTFPKKLVKAGAVSQEVGKLVRQCF